MDDERQQIGLDYELISADAAPIEEAQGAAPIAPAPQAAVAGPVFCRTCGSVWEAEWLTCPTCDARVRRAAEAQGGPLKDDLKSIKQSVAFYFTLLGICLIGLIASQLGSKDLTVDLIVTFVLSGVVLVWALFNGRDALAPLTRIPHPGWFGAAAGMGVLTFGIAMGVMYSLQHFFRFSDTNIADPYRQGGYGWGVVILAIAVQPAVIEELAFRGIITGALLRALTAGETIVVGALMFMILHLSPARFPHTLALGLAAGFLRVRTGSLYPCMLLHFTHNALCVGAEWMVVG